MKAIFWKLLNYDLHQAELFHSTKSRKIRKIKTFLPKEFEDD